MRFDVLFFLGLPAGNFIFDALDIQLSGTLQELLMVLFMQFKQLLINLLLELIRLSLQLCFS